MSERANPPRECMDDVRALALLERLRWSEDPHCPDPECESPDVYRMRSRDGGREIGSRWRCRDCSRQYTVRAGTVMEDSRVPLRVWCLALWAASTFPGGVTARYIARKGGISYKSALFLMERVRWAMLPDAPASPSDQPTGETE